MVDSQSTSGVRREYTAGKLSRAELHADPICQFEQWLAQLRESNIIDPTAMSLATVDEQGRPFQRTVLLKGIDHRGLVFFSNLESRKAVHMRSNRQVALHFLWSEMDRQVSVGGTVDLLSERENIDYFQSRPRDSQIAAWVSKQSAAISSRRELEEKFIEIEARFKDRDVDKPEFWGGYRVFPQTMEFWQGGLHRLHDRFLYSRLENPAGEEEWKIQRLSP